MLKLKIFQHSKVKINYTDDLPKVVKFFKDKVNLDVEFSAVTKTDTLLKDTPDKLYLPNDNKEQDILMYVFDRVQRSNSFSLNFSPTLQCIEISTSKEDDHVDYTWKLICHEIMHTFFHRLNNMGVFALDPMDSMIVGGVVKPYYKNEEPYSTDGNFAIAFKTLSPYWNKLYPHGYQYFSQAEVDKWKLKKELWEALDTMRGLANTPFQITSGYRTPEENKKAGGKPNSSHLRGLAVDLLCTDSHKRYLMLKGILGSGVQCFVEVAAKHIHIDLDLLIHPLESLIIDPKDD